MCRPSILHSTNDEENDRYDDEHKKSFLALAVLYFCKVQSSTLKSEAKLAITMAELSHAIHIHAVVSYPLLSNTGTVLV